MAELSIAIPASVVSDVPHLREKTVKIGMVGRAASIFGVDKIIVFPDIPEQKQNREIDLITTILAYMETPQYLRKRLFKIRPELGYAGVLPPLRTPHHPLPNQVRDLVDGEFREGATVAQTKDGTIVDIGVEENALIRNKRFPIDTRLTVRIKKTKPLEAEIVNPTEIGKYWGYRISPINLPFGRFLKKRPFDLVVATSKHGTSITKTSEELMNRMKNARKVLLAFGAPTRGMYEIVNQEKLYLDDVVDFVINTIPNQETETVRTEEAVFVTLGVLNLMVAKD